MAIVEKMSHSAETGRETFVGGILSMEKMSGGECPVDMSDSHVVDRLQSIISNIIMYSRVRDGVLEDWPRPRGHLEDKILWPWPWLWPRRCASLIGFGFEIWPQDVEFLSMVNK